MSHIYIGKNMEGSYITRQDILNFPFPYKLWLVIHLDFCDFLCWNRDGTVLLLDLVALEDYLNSTRSIFHIKNRSVFLTHLEEFQFERLNAIPEAGEDILLQYKNKNFQRHRLDLLAKIRRCAFRMSNEESTDKGAISKNKSMINKSSETFNSRAAERMKGDLCFMIHGSLSKIQKSRLRFQTVLNFQNETRILEEKLQASDEVAAQQRLAKSKLNRGGGRGRNNSGLDEEQVIELPVELFENPHDSILHLGDDFRPEYAGYYGTCSKELITRFFGDYLPTYEDGSIEIKKNVTEPGVFNISELHTERVKSPQAQISEDITLLGRINNSTRAIQRSLPTLNFSSALEPIFKSEEEQENVNYAQEGVSVTAINQNCMDTEVDISMDEFIKFKDISYINSISSPNGDYDDMKALEIDYSNVKVEETASVSPQPVEFPQMPTAIKMEIIDQEDNEENEANFRNFFSQYRASLNLLYERQ
uniref:HSF-type DNA-binding domain-containing protein n=1 Tax=Glossina brevipalpis TaxID=37001 RepID=A0A1A9WWL9_9MUSC